MRTLRRELLKEYCQVLGLCYGGMISFAVMLYLSLLSRNTDQAQIIDICLNFLFFSIVIAIIIVTFVFTVMYYRASRTFKKTISKEK